jgi:hypothetical protein
MVQVAASPATGIDSTAAAAITFQQKRISADILSALDANFERPGVTASLVQ